LCIFLPERAPQIGNTVELFFIDACRGKQENTGIIVPRGGREVEPLRIPKQGNFLLAYSQHLIIYHTKKELRVEYGLLL
jgi:hypothetical protein